MTEHSKWSKDLIKDNFKSMGLRITSTFVQPGNGNQ
jgi:hypothetical protein